MPRIRTDPLGAIKGFSIIELLVVITIIGIIAAIAIPNLLNGLQRGKQKSTMSDIRSIGTAVESYQIDYGHPPHQDSFGDIAGTIQGLLEPTYIKILATEDSWNTGIKYISPTDDNSYSIRSCGKDRINDGNTTPGTTTKYNNDILYSNGQFTIWPDGLQN